MSEKRFEKGYDDKGNALFIYDNQTDKMYYLEAINLLNSLNDELEDSSAFIIEQRKENKGLREENEQLRRRVEKLQEEIRAYPINEQYAEEIMQQNQKLLIEKNDLRIENDELKEKLDNIRREVINIDMFSDEALNHDIIAYREMHEFDNKDCYDIAWAIEKIGKECFR